MVRLQWIKCYRWYDVRRIRGKISLLSYCCRPRHLLKRWLNFIFTVSSNFFPLPYIVWAVYGKKEKEKVEGHARWFFSFSCYTFKDILIFNDVEWGTWTLYTKKNRYIFVNKKKDKKYHNLILFHFIISSIKEGKMDACQVIQKNKFYMHDNDIIKSIIFTHTPQQLRAIQAVHFYVRIQANKIDGLWVAL